MTLDEDAVRIAADEAVPLEVTPHGIHARCLVRDVVTAYLAALDRDPLVEAAREASEAFRLYNRRGLSWREVDAVFARLDVALREGDKP
jgi:hypothetical protein